MSNHTGCAGSASPSSNINEPINGDTLYEADKEKTTEFNSTQETVIEKNAKSGGEGRDTYNLCWKEFASNLGSFFREIKDSGDFVDVTLACEGHQLPAHQVVLSAASPFFRQLLKGNPCQHPIVILNEIRFRELAPLLQYIYHGEVEVPRHLVPEFLKTAKYLQVRGLQSEIDEPLCSDKSDDSKVKTRSPSPKKVKEAIPLEQTVTVSSTQCPVVQSPSIEASTSTSPSSELRKNPETPTDTVRITAKSPSPKKSCEESRVSHSVPSSPVHKKPKLSLSHSVYENSQSPGPRMTPPSLMSHPLASALKPVIPPPGMPVLPGVSMPPMPIPPSSFSSHPLPSASAAQAFSQHMSQQMSHHFSQQMSHHMSHQLSHHMSQQMSQQMSQHMSQQMSHQLSQQMSQQMNQQLSQHLPQAPSDDASDTCASDKSEDRSHSRPDQDGDEEIDGNSLEKMSGLANMAALKGLGGFPGPSGLMGLPGIGSSPHPDSSPGRPRFDFYRVRATDPRPCQLCGKIYKNAHTLRTHMEDKHSNCNGFRCVLCGTVAKSRNSLHSHMSRQHRGISTKDLPLLPMPSPWSPEIASKYIHIVGGVGEVVRQNYRRPDRDRNESSENSRSASSFHENGTMSPFIKSDDMKDNRGYDAIGRQFDMGGYGGIKPPIPPSLLDTYLQMVRATGGDFMPPGMMGGRPTSVLDLTRASSPNRMDDDEGRASDNYSDDDSGGMDDKQNGNRTSHRPAVGTGARSPASDDNDSNKWQVQ
ncbi:BTB/POZ domain [Trinorchestia longiramus]|nr:BTB/POZ domain [Trinorchestia longiramus]